MAGLWEHWEPAGAPEPIDTFTILTSNANDWMKALHDRMPVVLDPDDLTQWLDPATRGTDLQTLLRPLAYGELEAFPVSKAVGNVRNDWAELIEEQ